MSETQTLNLAFLPTFPLPLPILLLNRTTTAVTPVTPVTAQEFALAVYADTGGGTVTPAGVTHYTIGTAVNVTVTPSPGYEFVDWELDGVNVGTANPISITMDTNHLLVAVTSAINTIVIPNAVTEELGSPIFDPPLYPSAIIQTAISASVSFA